MTEQNHEGSLITEALGIRHGSEVSFGDLTRIALARELHGQVLHAEETSHLSTASPAEIRKGIVRKLGPEVVAAIEASHAAQMRDHPHLFRPPIPPFWHQEVGDTTFWWRF